MHEKNRVICINFKRKQLPTSKNSTLTHLDVGSNNLSAKGLYALDKNKSIAVIIMLPQN
jgi:hypothetical protein